MTQRILKSSPKTVEGKPCKVCGNTLRYIKICPSHQAQGVKNGACVACRKRSKAKLVAKSTVRKPEVRPKEEWGYEDYDI